MRPTTSGSFVEVRGLIGSRYSQFVTVWALVLVALTCPAPAAAQAGGPTIDVWYGDHQLVGSPGVAQRWYNVLGDVSDPDGIRSLSYSLNGQAAKALSVGPDTRRLYSPGSFNVELSPSELSPGLNDLVITATDQTFVSSQRTITLEYFPEAVWPESVAVDFAAVTHLPDVVQIVDGEWLVDAGGLHTGVVGYDRIVAVGDMSWDDYEITATITMHSIDPNGYNWPSVSPGFGVSAHWPGHTAWDGKQPTWGWTPAGAGVWYDAGHDGPLSLGGEDGLSAIDVSRVLAFDIPYVFKLRVQTVPGEGNFYAAKVWEAALPEPVDWELSGMEGPADLATGSCIIVAHHVDLTVADVVIEPLADPNPPVIRDIVVETTDTTATISWKTNERTTGDVTYGPTVAYEDGAASDGMTALSHAVTLTGLTPNQGYHYEITAVDVDGNATPSGDKTFRAYYDTAPPVIGGINVTVSGNTATVTWTTDELATSQVDYGTTNVYGTTAENAALTMAHSMVIGNLSAESSYHFQVSSADVNGNTAVSDDQTLTVASGIVSDDFSGASVDTGLWTFTNPYADASIVSTGTQVQIVLPATGQGHDVWPPTYGVPRLMQPVNDTDFTVEAKFESPLTTDFQSQGILIEQDDTHLIRAEFHRYGGQRKLFVGTISGSTASTMALRGLSVTPPMYMRINRTGSEWTVSYSVDGNNWTTGARFTHAMAPAAIGVFAGNSGETAHTATVDYFFNTAYPIVPEDGTSTGLGVTVNVVGNGTVGRAPDQASYLPGDSVTLTAVPDAGWTFSGWSGDLIGSTNPVSLTLTQSINTAATFVQLADTTPPVIGNVQVTTGPTSAAITWTTDEPTTGLVNYGSTTAYDASSPPTTLSTSHAVQIDALIADSTYHFELVAQDASANVAASSDLTFTTSAATVTGLVSDDFSSPSLDAGVWTFVNPYGDATLAMTGTQAQLSLPANGQSHDIWPPEYGVPRLMQAVNDTDFTFEAKFESPLTTDIQSQGFVVEQDAENVIRIEFHRYGGGTKFYVATIAGGAVSTKAYKSLSMPAPMHLRTARVDDVWTISHSTDGATWTTGATFTHPMTVTAVGVFAGNSAGTAHTATIDYFFDSAAPIVPEDGGAGLSLTVDVIGNGSVTRNPNRASYQPGEQVTLTATPDTDWVFDGWSGDLSGATNPLTITMDANVSATAGFGQTVDTTPPVIGNVQIATTETSATVSWTTNEATTGFVDFGLTSNYTSSATSTTPATTHSIALQPLSPGTTYHFEIVAEDAAGNIGVSGDGTLTTAVPVTTGIASDDFSTGTLDTGVWSFIDPYGDTSLVMTGTQAQIVLPANGQTHDVWPPTYGVPRLMQAANNTDFTIEAGFDSPLTTSFQSQGILIEQDATHLIRVEFHHYNGAIKLFAATLSGGSASIKLLKSVSLGSPMLLRVGRSGNLWTVSHSVDGVAWTVGGTFSFVLNAAAVGVFAGNSGDTAHTATIDYFFDSAAPIVPEDGGAGLSLTVDVAGSGSVTRSPNRTSYQPGEQVTLAATPDTGWVFDGWGGDLAGLANPVTIVMDASVAASVNFSQLVDTAPPVIGNVQVLSLQTSATISWTTNEATTGIVDYGLSSGYTDFVSSDTLSTTHSVLLPSLDSGTPYHFEIVAEDASGNVAASADATFTTDLPVSTGVVSDGFDTASLDSSVWTFINPFGDASVSMTGTQAEIVLPANSQIHDVWPPTNGVPRIMQAANDVDFSVDAKFDSPLTADFQSQGILIEQDATHLIRVEFHHYGGSTKVFAATINGGSASIKLLRTLSLAAPMYLRVGRAGDRWSVSHSLDGAVWTTASSFTNIMSVTSVGFFAGNSANTAHTATIDFFLDSTTAGSNVSTDVNDVLRATRLLGGDFGYLSQNTEQIKAADGRSVRVRPSRR